jgi:hypothetical protein
MTAWLAEKHVRTMSPLGLVRFIMNISHLHQAPGIFKALPLISI